MVSRKSKRIGNSAPKRAKVSAPSSSRGRLSTRSIAGISTTRAVRPRAAGCSPPARSRSTRRSCCRPARGRRRRPSSCRPRRRGRRRAPPGTARTWPARRPARKASAVIRWRVVDRPGGVEQEVHDREEAPLVPVGDPPLDEVAALDLAQHVLVAVVAAPVRASRADSAAGSPSGPDRRARRPPSVRRILGRPVHRRVGRVVEEQLGRTPAEDHGGSRDVPDQGCGRGQLLRVVELAQAVVAEHPEDAVVGQVPGEQRVDLLDRPGRRCLDVHDAVAGQVRCAAAVSAARSTPG